MPKTRYAVGLGALLVLSAIICGLSLFLSRRGFDGYDLSPMIDSGWRVYSGQIPGRDFVITFPPSLYLLTALFFRFFGVNWHALALGACWFYVLMLLLGLRLTALLRRALGDRVALWTFAGYTAGNIISLIIANTLWHSALATDFALYLVVATIILTSSRELPQSVRVEATMHATLAISCLILSKPNIAYPAILLCLLVWIMDGISRRMVAAVAVSALVLVALALASVHVTIPAMLAAYSGLTGRLLPKAFLSGILYQVNSRFALANLLVYAILVPMLATPIASAWKWRRSIVHRPVELLAIGAILIALLGMGTNFQFKLSDTPLAILGATLLAVHGELASPAMRRAAFTGSCALVFAAMFFGRTRLAFEITGGWSDEGCSTVQFHDPFLGSMKGCKIIPSVLTEIDGSLQTDRPSHVFFGPGLEFLYAGRDIPSPRHLPNWWDPGTSFPLSQADKISEAWQQNNFDLLVFLAEEDREQLPSRIRSEIAARYTRVGSTQFVHLYRRSPIPALRP